MSDTRKYVVLSLLVALMLAFTFTPLGYIQFGAIRITFIHIPVIIGSLWFGWKTGALLGFTFGLLSFITNSFTLTSITSFVFTPLVPVPGTTQGSLLSLIIVFVPRILVGILPHFAYKLTHKASVAAIVGSMTNTILVLGLIYLLFGQAYSAARGISIDALLGVLSTVVVTNGLAEAVLATAIITPLFNRVNLKDA